MCRARTKRKEKRKKETRVEPNLLIDRQRDRKKEEEERKKKKKSFFLYICSQKTSPYCWGRLLMLLLALYIYLFDKVSSFLFG
jgi:hypothetical protein